MRGGQPGGDLSEVTDSLRDIDIILIVTGALTFDLLHQDGVDLRSLALSDRKRDFPGQRAFLSAYGRDAHQSPGRKPTDVPRLQLRSFSSLLPSRC